MKLIRRALSWVGIYCEVGAHFYLMRRSADVSYEKKFHYEDGCPPLVIYGEFHGCEPCVNAAVEALNLKFPEPFAGKSA